MKKALVIAANGFEEIEAMAVIDILRRADVQVVIAGLESLQVTSARGVTILADELMSVTHVDEFDVLILPGGEPGATTLSKNETVLDVILSFYNRNKFIAAICASPKVLAKAGVLSGKRVACYPGTPVNPGRVTDDLVCVDGKIITSKGPATAMLFAYTILDQLGLSDISAHLQEKMLMTYVQENQNSDFIMHT